jgi:hypothetical protein
MFCTSRHLAKPSSLASCLYCSEIRVAGPPMGTVRLASLGAGFDEGPGGADSAFLHQDEAGAIDQLKVLSR